MSEMIISWYKEANEVDIPFDLFSEEDRDKATYWDKEKQSSMLLQRFYIM